jgi:hypothetical protein
MSRLDILSIAIPAVGLVIFLVSAGPLRWGRRPWFLSRPPRRKWFVVVFTALLVNAIVRVSI